VQDKISCICKSFYELTLNEEIWEYFTKKIHNESNPISLRRKVREKVSGESWKQFFIRAERGIFTPEEVSLHCTKDDGWIIINDNIIDVTKFIQRHPGGADLLIQRLGQDVSIVFKEINHSSNAAKKAERMVIGRLKPYKRAIRSRTTSPVVTRRSKEPFIITKRDLIRFAEIVGSAICWLIIIAAIYMSMNKITVGLSFIAVPVLSYITYSEWKRHTSLLNAREMKRNSFFPPDCVFRIVFTIALACYGFLGLLVLYMECPSFFYYTSILLY